MRKTIALLLTLCLQACESEHIEFAKSHTTGECVKATVYNDSSPKGRSFPCEEINGTESFYWVK